MVFLKKSLIPWRLNYYVKNATDKSWSNYAGLYYFNLSIENYNRLYHYPDLIP
jgi:hypothetical protein